MGREGKAPATPQEDLVTQDTVVVPLAQLSDTYQVVTQTRWMRPDAKSANSKQRRTAGREQGASGAFKREMGK